ncbi:MAG: MotA/TolQ/ExbB proton channel family protein [Pirellulales bacterium]
MGTSIKYGNPRILWVTSRRAGTVAVVLAAALFITLLTPPSAAQDGDEVGQQLAAEGLAAGGGAQTDGGGPSLLQLIFRGGVWMIPIAVLFITAATFAIERALGLRRDKVLPEALTRDFGRLSSASGGFDPRRAYRICQTYPCAAANVVRAMLLKIGRPHSEVEHAATEANEREAAKLYSNVRWLNLASAIAPLMGLFGTVWGMVKAFYQIAPERLLPNQSKFEVLADGITVALMTTLGGLFVAIPAAIAAHYFEGRIQQLFREIDELLFTLLPQVECYEGKLRVSREQLSSSDRSNKGEAGEHVVASAAGDSATGQSSTAPPVKPPAATEKKTENEETGQQPAETSS